MPDGTVQSKVSSEFARGKLSPAQATSLAVALALAESLDDPAQFAAGRAAAAKQLEAVLVTLRASAEPVKGDAVDDLTARRASRRSAG